MRFYRTPFTYSYVANANLIDTVSQAGGYSRDYDYLSTSNRLDQMKHQWGTNSASAVETRVTYDPSSQLRNTEKTQGSAWMTVLGRGSESGVHTDYSYTDRYELTSSGKYLLDADWSVGTANTDTARDYAFAPMGNRTSDETGNYTPNELNQYTATPTAATLTYDANGNLTNDGVATYAYDAENRLITMNRVQGAKSRYTYDYLGRRIRKTATGMTTQRYLYDGWNLIAELDDSGTITRQFVWGLDVSGSTQGAGGVGGLLEIDAGGTSQYYPIYDASHNVIGLYSGTGAIAAAYEYDPFGNKQTGLGTYAAANPFRFSTKYTDPDSGLVYYGMRYYSAKLGRFLNQDPIEEAGGINLYAFCGNDGVNRFDLLGMDGGFFDWLGSIFGGGSSSPSSRPPDIPGEYADATVGLPEITVGGGGNPGQSGDASSAGDSSHYDAIKSYQDGRTIDDVNASMRSNNGSQSNGLTFGETMTAIGQGIIQGLRNMNDAITFPINVKVGGALIETKAFGGKASFFNLTAGQNTVAYNNGGGKHGFEFTADIVKLSYKNIAFGLGAGREFGIEKVSASAPITTYDRNTSVLLWDVRREFGNAELNATRSTIGARTTLLFLQVGVEVDIKRFFGFGGKP